MFVSKGMKLNLGLPKSESCVLGGTVRLASKLRADQEWRQRRKMCITMGCDTGELIGYAGKMVEAPTLCTIFSAVPRDRCSWRTRTGSR
jgi:hypothetical protein